MSSNNSWPALRSISQIIRVLAYVAGVLGGLFAIITLFTGTGFLGRVGGFAMILLFTAIYVLFLIATSEGIMVGLAIEENTRKTAEGLSKEKK